MTTAVPLSGDPSPDPDSLRDFHYRWPTIQPPLRPTQGVAAAIGVLLAERGVPLAGSAGGSTDDATLLLGVTPELAIVPRNVIAVDWNPDMIRIAWPGDTPRRRAIVGDWKRLPLAETSVAAAIGDGALSMLRFPIEQPILFDQLRRVVRPGGRIVIRCFATPDPCETPEQVRTAALAGDLTFHSFKHRFNMAISAAEGLPNIESGQLHIGFERLFPDRAALIAASGWSAETIAEIDAYRGSGSLHCYPSRSQLLDLVPGWARDARFVETDGYPLAERCPLLVVDLP